MTIMDWPNFAFWTVIAVLITLVALRLMGKLK